MQVLAALKKSNFKLLTQTVQFDENGDPMSGSSSIVFWNNSGDAEEVGFYKFHPFHQFFIDRTKIQWHSDGEVTFAFFIIVIESIYCLRCVFHLAI